MPKFTRAEVRNILGEACTDEIENKLIALHIGVVDPMKDELSKLKGDIEKLDAVQKELDGMKEKEKTNEDWKAKFDKEHADFGEYKAMIEKSKAESEIKNAYHGLLKETGLDDKLIDTIIRGTDFSTMKLVDGKIENADKLVTSIKEEWKEFIPVVKKIGVNVPTPPKNAGNRMTLEQIDAIKDTAERQKAMLENRDLFGI